MLAEARVGQHAGVGYRWTEVKRFGVVGGRGI